MVDRPLASIRVIDHVRGPLAGATRYLAELGAQVDRMVAPEEDQLAEAILHAGKHSVPQDQRERFLSRAHLVFDDAGLTIPDVPGLVVLRLGDFGADSALAGWQASDAVMHALSGELSRSGIRGRRPLLPPGRLAYECAAAQVAFVGLQYLYRALRSGQGAEIEIAALDAAVQALDPGYGIGGSATLGRPARLLSRERPIPGIQYPVLPCADGFVRICLLAARQWQGMFRWMGEPSAFADPAFNKTAVRYKSRDLLPAIAAFFADKTREELEEGAIRHGVPLSGLSTFGEVANLPHLVERAAFRRVAFGGDDVLLPNGCIKIDGERMTPEQNSATFRQPCSEETIARPFDGLKVLDLGIIVVGAESGRLMADQGAEVVKVESRAFPDGNRQSYLPYGLSTGFAAGHRNKRGLGLDLRQPQGRDLFLRLVAKADVLLSNFKPGTMESLGLDRATLEAINPRLVTVESSAFGDTGPWSRRMGYGPLVRAAMGLTNAWRYPEDEKGFSDSITIYPDHVAARVGAMAAVALLIRRLRTGTGGRASVAQSEVLAAQFGREIAGVPTTERSTVYACAGEDEWCVVTERDGRDASAIAKLVGIVGAAEWMRRHGAFSAAEAMQAVGVPAAPMLRVADLPDLPYYVERGLFREERHPYLAEVVTAEALQATGHAIVPPRMDPAPLLGEHSDAVLADWLGVKESGSHVQHVDDQELRLITEALAQAADEI